MFSVDIITFILHNPSRDSSQPIRATRYYFRTTESIVAAHTMGPRMNNPCIIGILFRTSSEASKQVMISYGWMDNEWTNPSRTDNLILTNTVKWSESCSLIAIKMEFSYPTPEYQLLPKKEWWFYYWRLNGRANRSTTFNHKRYGRDRLKGARSVQKTTTSRNLVSSDRIHITRHIQLHK